MLWSSGICHRVALKIDTNVLETKCYSNLFNVAPKRRYTSVILDAVLYRKITMKQNGDFKTAFLNSTKIILRIISK
jgi:hypothetical protein